MKSKSITKKILKGLLIGGVVVVAASSPFFLLQASKTIFRERKKKKYPKKDEKRFENAFYYMKRQGYIKTSKQGQQIYVSLTEKGKKMAGKYQINNMEIAQPKEWDGLWRIVVFDVPDLTRTKREALRGKLKELGFQLFQRSVWVHPFECEKEINLLREFFGLNKEELTLIEGTIKHDQGLKESFGL